MFAVAVRYPLLNLRWLESGKVDLVMNSAKDRISSA